MKHLLSILCCAITTACAAGDNSMSQAFGPGSMDVDRTAMTTSSAQTTTSLTTTDVPTTADVPETSDTAGLTDGGTTGSDATSSTDSPAVCGDGVVEGTEQCDDGNSIDDDGCRGCRLPACHDGVIDPGELCHALAKRIDTDLGPSALALADMDLDGQTDVVTVVARSHSVQTLFLTPDGELDRSHAVLANAEPVGLAVGDVDGDGDPDVVLSNPADFVVSMLENVGGTLTPPSPVVATASQGAPLLAHSDLDGRLDLIVPSLVLAPPPNPATHELKVYAGDGQGSFELRTKVPLQSTSSGAAIADLDLDGRADMLVGSLAPKTRMETWLGDGHHDFDSAGWVVLDSDVSIVATGHLDGDDIPDVVFGYVDSNEVVVAIGDGSGAFGSVDEYDVGEPVTSIAPLDLDSDGDTDLAVGRTGRKLALLLGDGSGRFTLGSEPTLSGAPAALTTGDINGDGVDDILAAMPDQDAIARMLSSP